MRRQCADQAAHHEPEGGFAAKNLTQCAGEVRRTMVSAGHHVGQVEHV